MKTKIGRIHISGIILLLWMAAWQDVGAQKNAENSLLWKISGKDGAAPSYLFGTYHLLNSGYLSEVPKVQETFERADGIVVEVEIDSSKLFQMMSMMVMADKKLSDLVTEDDYKLIASEVEQAMGTPMDMLAQFKPVSLTFMLTMAYAHKEGGLELSKYDGPPMDSYFSNFARKNKKPVSTFETMEEQMRILFEHDPVEEQARQLVEFVRSKDEMMRAQSDLLRLYKEQDLDGLYELYKKYEEQFGDATYLLDDRNLKWMKKLPGMLEKGNQFIAVGALHLTGDKSLIRLLQERGYEVTPVASR